MGDVDEELENRTTQVTHVVMLPFPARGHVNPMMHLATQLAAEDGLAITFVNSEANGRMMNKIGCDRGIRFLEIPDGLPDDADRSTQVIELCKSVMTDMAAHFDRLIGRLMEESDTDAVPRPTCIVADTWLTPFSIETAAEFGLSHISFWTQSAASFASLHAITANGRCPLPEDFSIPGATFLKPTDVNTFIQFYDPSDFMFHFVTGGFDTLEQSCWVILNTFQNLEHETIDYLVNKKKMQTILPMGPIVPLPFMNQIKRNKDKHSTHDDAINLWNENKGCLTWLNQFKPKSVLYVSFGSMALLSHHQIEEVAAGLEATQYPFLWVIRPNMIHGQSPTFDVNFLERVKDRACIVDWAPQLDILSHTSVRGFFTHGGWNSIVDAIIVGVPMLGWPYFGDQPMNCKCIEQGWKVGLRLQDDDIATMETLVSRNIIKAKVEQLMTNQTFQDKANEWSLLAKNASIEDGSSSNNFLSFVGSLKSHVFM